jgi:hypothetical protein
MCIQNLHTHVHARTHPCTYILTPWPSRPSSCSLRRCSLKKRPVSVAVGCSSRNPLQNLSRCCWLCQQECVAPRRPTPARWPPPAMAASSPPSRRLLGGSQRPSAQTPRRLGGGLEVVAAAAAAAATAAGMPLSAGWAQHHPRPHSPPSSWQGHRALQPRCPASPPLVRQRPCRFRWHR